VVRGGDVCELRHAALVQYHNYLIPAQQMQTIDIQAGYGLGGSALFCRNASRRSPARLQSTGKASSKWLKTQAMIAAAGGGGRRRFKKSVALGAHLLSHISLDEPCSLDQAPSMC
jgi:hypothetical protein